VTDQNSQLVMAGVLVLSLMWVVWMWWVLRRLILPKLAKPNKQPRQDSLSQSLYAPQTPRTWRTVINPYLDAPQTPLPWNPLMWQDKVARGEWRSGEEERGLHHGSWRKTTPPTPTPGDIATRAAGLDMLDRFLGGK